MAVEIRDTQVYLNGEWVANLKWSKRGSDSLVVLSLGSQLMNGIYKPFCRLRWAVGHGRHAHRFATLERAIEYILSRRTR